MEVRREASRAEWEAFLARERPPTFLQSWAWGETQAALGEEVVRLAAYDGSDVVGIAQAVTVTARRGHFLHVPHGPVARANAREVLSALLKALRQEAERRKLAFLRVSPIQPDRAEHRGLYRLLGFRPAPMYLHSERLWVLDVTPDEETLLAGMRKTTRNLIRRAEREGVVVRFGVEQLDAFCRLYAETARRDRFVPFPRRALEAEVAAFSIPNGNRRDFTVLRNTVKSQGTEGMEEGPGAVDVIVGVAERQGTPLAGVIVPLTAWSAFYHHGASVRTRENIPAAYALQWELIREAKRRGCGAYNFWGVYPPGNRRSGITLFKTGFGGREVPLVPTQDLSLSPRYYAAYAVDTLRRWRRGL